MHGDPGELPGFQFPESDPEVADPPRHPNLYVALGSAGAL